MARGKIAALVALLLAGCEFAPGAPAPRRCEECIPLCAPFEAASCEVMQYAESGKVPYVKCFCGGRASGAKGGGR